MEEKKNDEVSAPIAYDQTDLEFYMSKFQNYYITLKNKSSDESKLNKRALVWQLIENILGEELGLRVVLAVNSKELAIDLHKSLISHPKFEELKVEDPSASSSSGTTAKFFFTSGEREITIQSTHQQPLSVQNQELVNVLINFQVPREAGESKGDIDEGKVNLRDYLERFHNLGRKVGKKISLTFFNNLEEAEQVKKDIQTVELIAVQEQKELEGGSIKFAQTIEFLIGSQTRLKNVSQFFLTLKDKKSDKDTLYKRNIMRQVIEEMKRKSIQIRVMIIVNSDDVASDLYDTFISNEKFSKLRDMTVVSQSNDSTKERKLALEQFQNNVKAILITSKHLSRGIDVEKLNLVILFQIPREQGGKEKSDLDDVGQIDPYELLHRIGRTGRSIHKGTSLAIFNTKEDEKSTREVMGQQFGCEMNELTIIDKENGKGIEYSKIIENIHENEIYNQKVEVGSKVEWEELGVKIGLYKHLVSLNRPSPFITQTISAPKILDSINKREVRLFGFPNGTGQTLCFLIPALVLFDKKIAREETVKIFNKRENREIEKTFWFPQVIIIEPTKEIAMQVANEIRKYSLSEDLKYEVYVSEFYHDTPTQSIKGNFIVSTPGYMRNAIENNYFSLDKLKLVIIDEADQVLNAQIHEEGNQALFEKITAFSDQNDQQIPISFFSATFERDYQNQINDLLHHKSVQYDFFEEKHYDIELETTDQDPQKKSLISITF